VEPKFLVFLGFALLVGLLAIYSYREDRKRRRLLRSWTRSKGFTLYPDQRTDWDREYPGVKLFSHGYDRSSTLHVEGEVDGRRVRGLDYRFTTGSGKSRKTHRFAVIIVELGTPVIPLHLRRERVFDRIGEFLGGGDINFESDEFSRRFHVTSADRKWAYDVIHTGMMDFLLQADVHSLEFGFAELAVYRYGRLSGERCQRDVKLAQQIVNLVPDDVLAQLREGRR
jgi:hypothetical protein